MAERFQRLFTLTPNLYSERCPIIIEAGALLKDTVTGAIIAQIKMRNLGDVTISSCRVSIKAYATNGNEVEGVADFSYLDLNAGRGKEFGTKVPVELPDRTARSFSADINEIVFSDGTVKKLSNNQWKPVSKQITIDEAFDNWKLAKQYKIEVGGDAVFLPKKTDDFFLCTCGAINLESSESCYNCGRTYDQLIGCLNNDYLKEKAIQRNEREENERQKNEKKKKLYMRIGAAVSASLLIIIVLVIAIGKIPKYPCGVKQGDSYETVLKKAKNQSEKVYAKDGKIEVEDTSYLGVDCDIEFEFDNSVVNYVGATRWDLDSDGKDAIYKEWKSKLTQMLGSPYNKHDDWKKGGITFDLHSGYTYVSILVIY